MGKGKSNGVDLERMETTRVKEYEIPILSSTSKNKNKSNNYNKVIIRMIIILSIVIQKINFNQVGKDRLVKHISQVEACDGESNLQLR